VGNIKEKYMKEGIAEYEKRLSRFCKINFIQVQEESNLEKEGQALVKRLPGSGLRIALDLGGKQLDSLEFAGIFTSNNLMGISSYIFIIGGSDGMDETVLQSCDLRLCLSKMTFTHQMTRLILMEQLYRAMKINNNEVYHK
jgi:23S rRNA (pseudouridine1915-N3)-methyltransferase